MFLKRYIIQIPSTLRFLHFFIFFLFQTLFVGGCSSGEPADSVFRFSYKTGAGYRVEKKSLTMQDAPNNEAGTKGEILSERFECTDKGGKQKSPVVIKTEPFKSVIFSCKTKKVDCSFIEPALDKKSGDSCGEVKVNFFTVTHSYYWGFLKKEYPFIAHHVIGAKDGPVDLIGSELLFEPIDEDSFYDLKAVETFYKKRDDGRVEQIEVTKPFMWSRNTFTYVSQEPIVTINNPSI